jgi:hypothetical protein
MTRWFTSKCPPMSTDMPPLTARSSLETDALTSLFPRVVAITILVLVALISIRGSAGSKEWDRAAYVFSVVAALLLALRSLRRSRSTPSRFALLVAIGGTLVGIARVEHHPFSTFYWEGFGTSVALLSVPLALLIVPLSTRIRRSRSLSRVLAVPVLALAAFDGLSLFRDLRDFPVAVNNMFVLNEVLAPSAGRVPGANFIPQYTTLFGWIFVPFHHLQSTTSLANTATIMLSCFSITSVVLAVVLARRALPERSLWLAVGLTVPLTTVTALHSSIDSSIGSYLQDLPVRMFPAMLYSVLAVASLVALLQHSAKKLLLISLGVLAGLMAWNSQDFGIAVALSYGVVLLMATRGSLRKRALVLWLGGLAVGALAYPLWAEVIGHPLRFSYFALTARSFAGGAASSPIQIPGPVLFVLPLILGSAVVGGTLLWRAADDNGMQHKFQQHAVVTLAFVGMWSTVGFVYYLNRSFASGQLQIFLLPVGVLGCALLSLSLTVQPLPKGRRGTLWLLPVTLPIAVGLAAILQTPNPSVTLGSLEHPARLNTFSYTVPFREVSVAMAYAKTHGGGSVGYLGPNANYLMLSTGVHSRILYDDPIDFGLSHAAHQFGCRYVRSDPTQWLVAGDANDEEPGPFIVALLGASPCNAYRAVTVPGEAPDTVFELRDRAPASKRA